MVQLNTASIVLVISAPIFEGKLAKTYAVRLALVRLWELYAILMCQACWMVRATACNFVHYKSVDHGLF